MNPQTEAHPLPTKETLAPRATPVHFIPGIVTDLDELRKPCRTVRNMRDGLRIASELRSVLERNNKRFDNAVKKFMRKEAGRPTVAPGVGLAAPQIGIQERVAYVMADNISLALVNPRILRWSEAKFEYQEGCLSMPGVEAFTYRHSWIEVTCDNWKGSRFFGGEAQFEQLLNVVVQHEIAHLSGMLPTDFENIDRFPTPDQWNGWVP